MHDSAASVDAGKLIHQAELMFMQPSDEHKNILKADIVPRLLSLLKGDDVEAKERLAQVLGDAARDEYWRIFIGETGLLKSVLVLLQDGTKSQNVKIQVMRVMANSCADTDANRNIVVKERGIVTLLQMLRGSIALASVALVVLYNVCMDYAPAQKASIISKACQVVLDFVTENYLLHDELSDPVNLSYCIKILELLLNGDHAEEGCKSCPDDAANILVNIAKTPSLDFDDFTALLRELEALLELPRCQACILIENLVQSLLQILTDSYTRFGLDSSEDSMEEGLKEDDKKVLVNLRQLLVGILSNISCLDSFTDYYPLSSPLVAYLKDLLSLDHAELQTCAAIMLGNLARSDEACKTLIVEEEIHVPLVHLLQGKSRVGVLHAAAGILKNLAISGIEAKEKIGALGAIEMCTRFYEAGSMGQIQYIGVNLVRVLISGCVSNTKRLLSPVESFSGLSRTHLELLLELDPKTDELPVQTEISRIVVAILRLIYSTANVTDNNLENAASTDLTKLLFQPPELNLARPLLHMIYQTKWPVIRSEGWFALALLARSREGREMIFPEISRESNFWTVLFDTLGRGDEWAQLQVDSVQVEDDGDTDANEIGTVPKASEVALQKDKDNAIIFITELAKISNNEKSAFDQTVFGDILSKASLKDYLHKLPIKDEQIVTQSPSTVDTPPKVVEVE